MIQFLVSIIEWFAVVALSSIGIEAESVSGCASNQSGQPAEYREAIMWSDASDATLTRASLMADPCPQWVPASETQDVPELLAPPLVYTS